MRREKQVHLYSIFNHQTLRSLWRLPALLSMYLWLDLGFLVSEIIANSQTTTMRPLLLLRGTGGCSCVHEQSGLCATSIFAFAFEYKYQTTSTVLLILKYELCL